jgi:hypothetical protein
MNQQNNLALKDIIPSPTITDQKKKNKTKWKVFQKVRIKKCTLNYSMRFFSFRPGTNGAKWRVCVEINNISVPNIQIFEHSSKNYSIHIPSILRSQYLRDIVQKNLLAYIEKRGGRP